VSGSNAIKGSGAALAECANVGCLSPVVDLGAGGLDSGRNAFTLNVNPVATSPTGINLSSAITSANAVPAAGNEWEHCDVPASDPVNAKQVLHGPGLDARRPCITGHDHAGRTHRAAAWTESGCDVDLACTARGRRLRPRLRGQFNAIDGGACHPPGLPADPCSMANAAVVSANAPNVPRAITSP
jgi:hypothetical protein